MSLPFAGVAEGLAILGIEEGEIEIVEGRTEIEEYDSEEELAPDTCATNLTTVRKVVKTLGFI